MILLQAAIGYALVLITVFGGGVLIGIPVINHSVSKRLKRRFGGQKTNFQIFLISIIISSLIIALILSAIWIFYLSKVDLTYS